MYYLQSRYYNPSWGRFINADGYVGADDDIQGYNMYSYCGNSPISREDAGGMAWDIVFDVISLASSIYSVISNPQDKWAWAGLVGDIVDVAIPFVGGIGEIVRGAKAVSKAADAADTLRDIDRSANLVGALCFVAGTLVLTDGGLIPIEEISVEDRVWAADPNTGETATKWVVQTFVSKTSELVHVYVSGEEIICTPAHPFYSPVLGWTNAIQLRAGDILVTVNGEYVVVEQVQHEILEAPINVYNFEVEGFHTYFVGFSNVLTHNKCFRDVPADSALFDSIHFDSERQARAFARTKVGHNPKDIGNNKLLSQDGRWRYRAKPNDVAEKHVHLERIDPKTGMILRNYHLRWD